MLFYCYAGVNAGDAMLNKLCARALCASFVAQIKLDCTKLVQGSMVSPNSCFGLLVPRRLDEKDFKKSLLEDVTCKLRLCICRSLGSAFCLCVNFLRPPR